MSEFLHSLHLLRPQWLWALLLLPVLMGIARYRIRQRNVWRSAVDRHLLVHLIEPETRSAFGTGALLAVAYVLAVLALSGPSWRMQEQPSWQGQRPLVVAMDLSPSILATDMQPSRLLQARAKLDQLLRLRQAGDVALVVYADDAFTVAPLTADTANLKLFINDLSPSIMPVPGQRPDRAISLAVELLQQARARTGDIVLLTGQSDAAAAEQAAMARRAGYRVSVLGLGSTRGASYRQADGALARTFLDDAALERLAGAGGGSYRRLSVDEEDLRALQLLSPVVASAAATGKGAGAAWLDEGYWLLLPLLGIALFAFRRQGVAAIVLACVLLPCMPAAHAAEKDESGWWQRADQRDHQRLADGVQAYRQQAYARAEQLFSGVSTPEGFYNLGNALARQGKYDAAIEAYDRALVQQPGMTDAIANRAAVDAARKRKTPPSNQPGNGNDKGKDGSRSSPPSSSVDKANAQGQQGRPQAEGDQPGEASPTQQRQPALGSAPSAPDPADTPAKSPAEQAAQQQRADQAQREQMQRAMEQAKAAQKKDPGGEDSAPALSVEERERQQAIEAWMQRVPDEPGNILKAKFQLEHERRKREGR